MTATLPLTMRAIELLNSGDAGEQIEGLVLALQIMRADMCVIEHSSSKEQLLISSLPRRVYERIFSECQGVSREAAYVSVACSRSFRHMFAHRARFSDLNTEERTQFVGSLLTLLAEIKLVFLVDVKTRQLRSLADGVEIEINVIVTRKLPFDVDGSAVLLQERELAFGDGVHIIGVRDGKKISENLEQEINAQDRDNGIVGKGSAVYVLRPAPTQDVPVEGHVVFYGCLEKFNCPLENT